MSKKMLAKYLHFCILLFTHAKRGREEVSHKAHNLGTHVRFVAPQHEKQILPNRGVFVFHVFEISRNVWYIFRTSG